MPETLAWMSQKRGFLFSGKMFWRFKGVRRFVGCPKNGETCFPGKSFWRFKGVQHFANVLSDVPF